MKFKINSTIINCIMAIICIVLMIIGAHLHYNQYFGIDYYSNYWGMHVRDVMRSWLTFYYTDLLLYIPVVSLFIQLVLAQIKDRRNNINKESNS